jgi:hypothetical protein
MFERIEWGSVRFAVWHAEKLYELRRVSPRLDSYPLVEGSQELSPKPDLTREEPANADMFPVLKMPGE